MSDRRKPLRERHVCACRHGISPPENCLQRWTRGCPEGDEAAVKLKEKALND